MHSLYRSRRNAFEGGAAATDRSRGRENEGGRVYEPPTSPYFCHLPYAVIPVDGQTAPDGTPDEFIFQDRRRVAILG